MPIPFQPCLPKAASLSRNPHPFVRADVTPWPARPVSKPGEAAAREPAPVRDLLASLGF